jgi:hypothetical protein
MTTVDDRETIGDKSIYPKYQYYLHPGRAALSSVLQTLTHHHNDFIVQIWICYIDIQTWFLYLIYCV